MAGLPFLLGFMSKETFYGAVAGGKIEALTLSLAAAVAASTLATIYALKLFVGTFWGPEPPVTDRGYPPDKISRWLLFVPAVLLVPQVVGGVLPGGSSAACWSPAPSGRRGWPSGSTLDVKLALSLGILVFGVGGFLIWRRLAALPLPPGLAAALGGARRGSAAARRAG
jgi:NADH:ubiquinone oxidoreductase subunit 5 (subunit L)/multisubunit Na+/H+ antiporter MnhA subunit